MNIVNVYCIQAIVDDEGFRMNIVNVYLMPRQLETRSDFV